MIGLELFGILLVMINLILFKKVFLQYNHYINNAYIILNPKTKTMSQRNNQQTTNKQKTKQITKQPKQQHQQKSKPIKDIRFKSAEYDPKFIAPKQNISKVKIDKRFADKMKSDKFKMAASVDKYGRKQDVKEGLGGMQDYYYTQEEPQIDRKQKNGEKQRKMKSKKQQPQPEIQEQSQNIEQEEQEEQEEQDISEQQKQKFQNNISKWMKEYDQQSDSDMEDEELDDMIEDSDGVWSDSQENVVKGEQVQVTRRLALCNYDWMNINAKDLMLLFSSFKPTAGTILSVSVFYSQLGKQKMEAQQRYGPQGIWRQVPQNNKKQEQSNKRNYQYSRKHQQQQAFNQRKLRAYEKERLKYCYAVIQCNSKQTADQLYKECDGNQFENSNILFDLRFIPDDLKFDTKMLKQRCDEIPVSGEVKNFVSRALGHSNVSLTWEDPELNSIASLKKKNWNKISQKQMDNIDWSMYINQNAQATNDNLNKIMSKGSNNNKNKISPAQNENASQDKKLNVSDWRQQCSKKNRKKEDDIQITFTSGFDSQIQKKEKDSLNKQLKTRKDRWRSIQQQKKRKQQMQLLVEKSDKKQFVYNPNDDRFKAVLDNPAYHIDPSNPKFDHRKVGAVFQEVVKKNRTKNSN